MQDMLVASLAQCPVIGGKVKSFDATAAKAVKGVVSVVQIPDGIAVLAKDFHIAKKGVML
jgi:isoquinoline 1-oxidoreductase beta subunit